jgi:hypothetical protein
MPTRVQKNLFQYRVKYVSCGYFHTGALIAAGSGDGGVKTPTNN